MFQGGNMILYYDFEDIVLEANTDGGRIESLTDGETPVLYPQVNITIEGTEKIRGGSHPCVPNFGIDTTTGLPPHGFGRDRRWDCVKKEASYSTLSLNGEGDYKNLRIFLSYEIGEKSLRQNLVFLNIGDEELLIAPGFHPYFPTKDAYIKIYDRVFDKNEMSITAFLDGDILEFETESMKYRYETKNCNRFAIWTDSDDYVCVEPTFNGPSFSEVVERPYQLQPGEEFNMDAILEWEIKK